MNVKPTGINLNSIKPKEEKRVIYFGGGDITRTGKLVGSDNSMALVYFDDCKSVLRADPKLLSFAETVSPVAQPATA